MLDWNPLCGRTEDCSRLSNHFFHWGNTVPLILIQLWFAFVILFICTANFAAITVETQGKFLIADSSCILFLILNYSKLKWCFKFLLWMMRIIFTFILWQVMNGTHWKCWDYLQCILFYFERVKMLMQSKHCFAFTTQGQTNMGYLGLMPKLILGSKKILISGPMSWLSNTCNKNM